MNLELELQFENPLTAEDRQSIYEVCETLLGRKKSFIDLIPIQGSKTDYRLILKLPE